MKKLLLLITICISSVSIGQTLEEIPNPPGIGNPSSGGYLGHSIVYNNELYLRYSNSIVSYLYKYDSLNLTLVPNLPNYSSGDAGGTGIQTGYYGDPVVFNGLLCMRYINDDGVFKMVTYNGTSLVEINDAVPLSQYSTGYMDKEATEYNGNLYIQYRTAQSSNAYKLGKFDGSNITIIPNPPNADWYLGESFNYNNELYLFYRTASGSRLFRYDGVNMNQVPSPAVGNVILHSHSAHKQPILNDKVYYAWKNANNSTEIHFFDGNTWGQVPLPPGISGTVSGSGWNSAWGAVYNDKLLLSLRDDALISSLYSYDGVNLSVEINDFSIPHPQQFQNKLILSNNNDMYLYDGNSFTSYSNPVSSYDIPYFLNKEPYVYQDRIYLFCKDQPANIYHLSEFDGFNFNNINNPPGYDGTYGSGYLSTNITWSHTIEYKGHLYLRYYSGAPNHHATMFRLEPNCMQSSTDYINACETHNWIDGQTYNASNNTKTWMLADQNGCDSLVYLNLNVNQPSTGSEVATECSSYTWSANGQTYTQSGQYTSILTNAQGCDSTVTLNLTITQPSSSSEIVSQCDSYTWNANGQSYTQSGQYTTVLMNLQGCDSTITVDLTITNSSSNNITETVCENYSAPDGAIYTSTGIYTAIIPNAEGCDSTITIDLTVNQPTTSSITSTNCDTYTAPDGTTYTTTGIYTAVIPNAVGCDSTITIDLTITNSTSSSITETVCDTYTAPDGATYTSTGNYTAVIPNAIGCDSTISINLTVNNANTGSETVTECDSYTWSANGQTYTQSGQYTEVLSNQNGCDSTVTLDLTINTANVGVTQVDAITLESDVSNAQYQWIDCNGDFQPLNGETNQSFSATYNSDYAVIVTENGCTDTSACITISSVGMEELMQNIRIYPNPATSSITISSESSLNTSFRLIDEQGRVVLTGKIESTEEMVDISKLSKGQYNLVFEDESIPVVSVIKQ